MSRSFHVYTHSNYFKDLYPDNYHGDYKLQFPHPIRLEGQWQCALVECVLPSRPPAPLYVCCDSIVESSTGDFSIPILRQVDKKTSAFENVLYHPLKDTDIHTLRLYCLTYENLPVPLVANGVSTCVLHFTRLDDDRDTPSRSRDDFRHFRL